MKDLKIPIAIVIASIIIGLSIIISSKNDPLANCIDRLLKSGELSKKYQNIPDATVICNRRMN